MGKTLMQRMNEANVEAAEMLLEAMKRAKDDIFALTNYADSISKLHVSSEPLDYAHFMAEMSHRVFGEKKAEPQDDYDEKTRSGLLEEE